MGPRGAFLLVLLAPVAAFWRLPCANTLTIERADPIVNPGTISGHSHTIMGASAFSALSTPESIRKSRCSTCTVLEDNSNYWIQNMYYQFPNGSFTSVEQNGGMLVYYLQRTGSVNKTVVAFPDGLRMVAGYPGKQTFDGSLAARAISYACLNYNGGGGPETHAFSQKNCPNNLRVQVFFPSCWNGRDLDSADHRSHMAYPSNVDSGDCPNTHPVRVISIFFEVLYHTERFASGWLDANGKPFRAQPFYWSTGDNTGFGHHGDFMNGWHTPTLAKAVDECTADSGVVEDCQHFTFRSNAQAGGCRSEYLPVTDDPMEGYMDTMPGLGRIAVPTFDPCGTSPQQANDNTVAGTPLGTCTTGYSGKTAYTSPVSGGDAIDTGNPARVALAPNPLIQEGYLGCYVTGQGGVATMTRIGSGNTYLPSTCRTEAMKLRYQYFALQYFGECWATNSSTSWSSQGTSDNCVGECRADPTYYCGQGAVNQVYSTYNLALPPTAPGAPTLPPTGPPVPSAPPSTRSPVVPTPGPTASRSPTVSTTRSPTTVTTTRSPTTVTPTRSPTTVATTRSPTTTRLPTSATVTTRTPTNPAGTPTNPPSPVAGSPAPTLDASSPTTPTVAGNPTRAPGSPTAPTAATVGGAAANQASFFVLVVIAFAMALIQ